MPSPAPRPIRTVCPHDCPDQCSMLAYVEDGRLVRVAGDPDHPFTAGFLCGKVNRYPERVHSPERLLTPLRRGGPKGGGRFEPIGWDEALTEIVTRWRGVIERHGNEALLGIVYSGHMGLINRNVARALFHALGATQVQMGTVCDSACEAGWAYTCGPSAGLDPERAADSDLIIAWGANLVSTNVHLLPFIERARARGARFIVVDPYRNRTARRADWHVAVRVDSDAALALGVMHVLVRDGLVDQDYIERYTLGFDRLAAEVLPRYTPEEAGRIAGIPAEDVEALAHAYGRARAPFIRIGMGLSRHLHGGMAVRTIACLPGLVGAWRCPGGGALLDTAAAFDFDYAALRRPDLAPRNADLAPRPPREVSQARLGLALTELRDPPVKALFIGSFNPATTCPDQRKVIAGLSREDLFTVVHDAFLTDTARYADIVLPATSALETEDLYRSYGQLYVQFGPQVLPPQGQARSNRSLVAELAQRLAAAGVARDALSDPVFSRGTADHVAALLATPEPDAGAAGSLSAAGGPRSDGINVERILSGEPVKMPVPPLGHRVADGFPTPSGRLEFYSQAMADEGLPPLPEWEPDPLDPAEPRYPLRLLTAPGHHQHHTAFAGVASLRRREGAPACLLHPADAAARGIADGDPVELFNDRGHVGLYARVTDDAPEGVVVVEGHRARHEYLSGGPVNVLTSDRAGSIGMGATYQSTWLDVRGRRC